MTQTRNTHRLRTALLIAAAVILILYIVLVNLLVSAALVPSFMKKLDSLQRITQESYSQQVHTSDISQNRKAALEATRAWLKEAECRKLERTSLDGYRLVAAEFPAEKSSHLWVVLLHGYTGWKEEMYPFAYWYHQQGFHVLAPDLRCQGESDGDFIGMGWTDREDVMLWLAHILEEDPEAEIVLHGQSMGGACGLMMSGMEELPENVRAVVSDCAYTDAYSMFRQNLRQWGHLPAFPLLDSMNLALQLRGGYDLRDASALENVCKSKVPILLIHGDKDAMIPVEMAYALYDAASGEKRLEIMQGAGHAQSQDKAPDQYYSAISTFLSDYLTIPAG